MLQCGTFDFLRESRMSIRGVSKSKLVPFPSKLYDRKFPSSQSSVVSFLLPWSDFIKLYEEKEGKRRKKKRKEINKKMNKWQTLSFSWTDVSTTIDLYFAVRISADTVM